jgi:hypothetical protein
VLVAGGYNGSYLSSAEPKPFRRKRLRKLGLRF